MHSTRTTTKNGLRRCARCRQVQPLNNFKKRTGGSDRYYRPYCTPCELARQNEWRKKDYKNNPERYQRWSLLQHRDYKETAINVYSNGDACCAWCKHADMDILCLDHINNDGKLHRKLVGRGSNNMYKWVRKNDYPPIFQVLCYNCNMKKLALLRESARLKNKEVLECQ